MRYFQAGESIDGESSEAGCLGFHRTLVVEEGIDILHPWEVQSKPQRLGDV